MRIKFRLNGSPVEVDVEPNELLINVLRDKLGITSVKYGCGIGECGACTVIVDGEPVLSCLTLAVEVDGRNVITVEGLQDDPLFNIIKKAFLEEGAIQCGYCTPGFVLMAWSLLRKNPKPTIDHVKEYLRGNICRCTGYVNILRAILKAAEQISSTTKK
ncbi:(2Fe-2S)-binding protein [Desulfurococcaceae archaeon MEX13E-LK6-19]|nr:(2Fe-2S)-binding protein [Desulfurococcaceae archaeon MEX13E-LK6-19]